MTDKNRMTREQDRDLEVRRSDAEKVKGGCVFSPDDHNAEARRRDSESIKGSCVFSPEER